MLPTRPRAVVSLSGGMDSAVCASLAARDYDAYALHFSYGQRTEGRELQSARAIAQELGFQDFLHLKIDLFLRIGVWPTRLKLMAEPARSLRKKLGRPASPRDAKTLHLIIPENLETPLHGTPDYHFESGWRGR